MGMAAKRGRPSKFTPERKNRILSLINAGNYLDTACQAAGVTYATYREWVKRGQKEYDRLEESSRAKPRESEKDYLDFFEAVQKAEATAEARNLTIINKAAEKNWQAAAWFLERKAPDRWGRKDRFKGNIVHENVGGNASSGDVLENLTEDELRRLSNLNC